jgi:hypothetical protein
MFPTGLRGFSEQYAELSLARAQHRESRNELMAQQKGTSSGGPTSN